MSLLTTLHGLNDKQTAFIVALRSMSPDEAAKAAGYEGRNAATYLTSLPVILQAMHADVQRNLAADVWTNIRVLRKLRDDDKVSAKVRADVALKLTNLAGVIVPTAKDAEGPHKPLAQMSQGELLEFIERNQRSIDEAEATLANQAKDVTPGASVSSSVPLKAHEPAKPLDYLD